MSDGGAGGSWGRVVTVCATWPMGLKEQGRSGTGSFVTGQCFALWLWILGFWLPSLDCLGFHFVFGVWGWALGDNPDRTMCLAWRAWMALFSFSLCCLHEHPHHLFSFSQFSLCRFLLLTLVPFTLPQGRIGG